MHISGIFLSGDRFGHLDTVQFSGLQEDIVYVLRTMLSEYEPMT